MALPVSSWAESQEFSLVPTRRGNAEEARRTKKIRGGALHFDHCKLGEARRVNILTNGNEVNVIRT